MYLGIPISLSGDALVYMTVARQLHLVKQELLIHPWQSCSPLVVSAGAAYPSMTIVFTTSCQWVSRCVVCVLVKQGLLIHPWQSCSPLVVSGFRVV